MKLINAILKLNPILVMACLIAGPLGFRAEAQTYTVPAAATSSQITAYTGLTQAQALAVDNAGNIFYANPTLGQLMEQPVSGGAPIVLYTEAGGGGSYPKGIAVDTLGNAYITDYSGHLWKVPVGGGTAVDILTACNSVDAYYLGTFDVSTDGSGNVYTIGQESDVFEITPAGTCSVVATPSAAPTHVASDPAGNVYYSLGTTLYSLPVGAKTPVAVDATFGAINGLRADAYGNLFVTDTSTIDEVPFVSGTLDASAKSYVVPMSSASDIGTGSAEKLYLTDGSNIYVVTPGSVVVPSTAVGTASAAETINVIFNAAETLSAINLEAGTGPSTEIANTGAGTCAIGQSYSIATSCTATVSVTPVGIGARNGAVQLATASGTVGTAFVSASGLGAGLVVDPGSQDAIGSGWTTPSGVAVDATGSIFVADSGANTVTYFPGGSGGTPQVIASALNRPAGVAVDANGDVYVVNSGAGTLLDIARSGGTFAAPAVIASGLTSPQGVAVTGTGDVYVANTGAGTLLHFPNEFGTVNFFDQAKVGTFTAPYGVTSDANGNIFVTDNSAGNLIELTNGVASTLATGLSSPTSVAVDPADDVYVLQSGSSTVELIPFVSGAYSTNGTKELGTGFATPLGLAADQAGNLYVADSGTPSVSEIARTMGLLNLGSLDLGDTSAAQNLTLSDDGNATLTLGSPYFIASGNTGDFTIGTAVNDGCAAGSTIATGSACGVSVVFSPTATGSRSELLQLQSNAANASGIEATVSGTGINLPKTTLTLALVSPTGTLAYGQTITVSAIVAPASGTGTPTGTVQFLVNGTDYGLPVALASGDATESFTNLSAGMSTITAIYSGDSNFDGSTGTLLSLTISLAATTTNFSSSATSANPVLPGTSVTFTAAVVSEVTSAAPTGTVTFMQGTTVLGSATVGTNGTATLTTSTLPQGTYAVTAVYSGDAGFAGSTSTAITISILPAQFTTSGTPTSLTVDAPGSVSTSFVVTPISGYTGGVDMACSGLPANTFCTFVPGALQFINVAESGATVPPSAQTVQLIITTDTAPPSPIPGAGFLFVPFGLLILGGRKRWSGSRCGLASVWMICVLATGGLLLMLPLSGCGSTTAATPTGSSAVTVTLTGTPAGTITIPTSGTGNIVSSFSLQLTVK